MIESLLLQPSLRDERGLALEPLIARLGRLDLSTLLVYAIAQVAPSALPHLAEQFHVAGLEGWDLAATDRERSHLVATAIDYHRAKGTLAGLQLAGRRAGLTIVQATTPPAKTYLAPARNRAERDLALESFPQLRLYRTRVRGQRVALGLYCHAAWLGTEFTTAAALARRLGWRAEVRAPGGALRAETVLIHQDTDRAAAPLDLEVRRPGAAGRGTYPAGRLGQSFMLAQAAGERLFNVRLTQPYSAAQDQASAVQPGLALTAAAYAVRAVPGVAGGVMLGRFVSGHVADQRACDRLWRAVPLFARAVTDPRRGRSTHVGSARLTMPAFTAELRTSVPGRRSPRLVGAFCAGYWGGAVGSRLERGLGALRLAVAVRDRVWIDTHDRQALRSGAAPAGRYRCGQIISRSV